MTSLSPSPPSLPSLSPSLLLPPQGVLAPITDLHYNYLTLETIRTLTPSEIIIIIIIIIMKCVIQCYSRADREKRVESAKVSITALLKSWPGKRGRTERTLLYIIIIFLRIFVAPQSINQWSVHNNKHVTIN